MLRGIFPPITTPIKNGKIAFDKLAENIRKYNQTELSGYVVFGSNGESPFLSFDEKVNLVASVKENASTQKIIIAGTGLESIRETIKLSNSCAANGADYALVLTPSFYKNHMDHQAFLDYFTAVADSIKIPLIIYNAPKFTGVEISAKTVSKLSEHANIIGIKSSSENLAYLGEIIHNTKNDFAVIAGTASILYPALTLGAECGILALANIAPNECVKIYNLYNKGEYEKALLIHLKLIEVNKAVTATYGVAGLKAAMDLLGYFGGDPIKPLRPLMESQINTIKNILIKANILN